MRDQVERAADGLVEELRLVDADDVRVDLADERAQIARALDRIRRHRRVLLEPLRRLLLADDLAERVEAIVERRLHDQHLLVRALLRLQARHQRLRLAREHRARVHRDRTVPSLPCPSGAPGLPASDGSSVHLEQLRGVDVRVALRRAQPRVAEQLLNRAQVGAALQQMRRERMPQRVRADAEPRARRRGVPAHQPIDAPHGQPRRRDSSRTADRRLAAPSPSRRRAGCAGRSRPAAARDPSGTRESPSRCSC